MVGAHLKEILEDTKRAGVLVAHDPVISDRRARGVIRSGRPAAIAVLVDRPVPALVDDVQPVLRVPVPEPADYQALAVALPLPALLEPDAADRAARARYLPGRRILRTEPLDPDIAAALDKQAAQARAVDQVLADHDAVREGVQGAQGHGCRAQVLQVLQYRDVGFQLQVDVARPVEGQAGVGPGPEENDGRAAQC